MLLECKYFLTKKLGATMPKKGPQGIHLIECILSYPKHARGRGPEGPRVWPIGGPIGGPIEGPRGREEGR